MGMHYRRGLEPMTTLTEVLTELATELNINPSKFCLKHHRLGYVAMNVPFSLIGVETNAQLDLVPAREPTGKTVCVGVSLTC
jgi:hypothetical protein